MIYKKKLAFILLFLSGVCRAAMPDYEKYMSNVQINNFSHGVYISNKNETEFFCIGLKKQGAELKIDSMCKVDIYGSHKKGFSNMLETVKFFYATGEDVRVYYKENEWADEEFKKGFSANELIAITTCSSSTYCMGPKSSNH